MAAKETAVNLLARREHSAVELRLKLQQRSFSNDEIESAIADLQQANLQSDERFAEAYIYSRQQKGFGPLRIAAELRERGVSEDIYATQLGANSSAWSDVLRQAYHRKYGATEASDFADKAKRIRFLQYRGFALEKIHELINT